MDGEMKDMVPEPSRAERPEGIARPQMTWRPYESAPKPHQWLRFSGRAILACLHEHRDEAGEPTGETTLIWAHVAYLTATGWMVSTTGFKGLHGSASFPLHENATHWMPLDEHAATQTLSENTRER